MNLEESNLVSWISNNVGGLGEFNKFKLTNNGVSRKTSVLNFTNKDIVTRQSLINHHAASQSLHREFDAQKNLSPFFPVSNPVIFCNDKSIVGHPFYIMDYSDGNSIKNISESNSSLETIKKYVESSFKELVNLHSLDPREVGINNTYTSETYIKNQIIRWSKEYKEVSRYLSLNLESVLGWLFENIPTKNSTSILHNDWRMDNIIFSKNDDGSVLSVLDWELFSVGDSLMDFGIAMGYWIDDDDPESILSLNLVGSHIKNFPKKDEVINFYFNLSGQKEDRWNFYYCFGLFKFASILQRGSNLYRSGVISNPKYSDLDGTIMFLIEKSRRAANLT
jgi:aminoglycoside phosphotransferase (APT) family kinase protein